MKILLLESFYSSSHKQWSDGLIEHSRHDITLLSLPGRHWKWRMHHAGQYFAFEIAKLKETYELILCSDLMNVAEFRGVLASLGSSSTWYNNAPVITYFHENQITYPWSKTDPDIKLKRDNHYGWINYMSCIASDRIVFNSQFHRNSFIEALPKFLNQFPQVNQENGIASIAEKSVVLPIGLNLQNLAGAHRESTSPPTILWNHRWEYDKNPEFFFNKLIDLKEKQVDFNLIVAGESYKKYPPIFDVAKSKLSDRIIHFGFAESRSQYESLLLQSDILPVTSNQDFFGISAVEAIAAGCVPILPNRLAFPEHLDLPEFESFYYDSEMEFTEGLVGALQWMHNTASRKHILKYDWGNVKSTYDDFFDLGMA